MNRRRSLAVGIVRVITVLLSKIGSRNPADPALGTSNHSDVARQTNRRLADAALDVSIQILLAIAGKIDHHAPGTHVQRELSHRHVAKMQSSLAGAHLDF